MSAQRIIHLVGAMLLAGLSVAQAQGGRGGRPGNIRGANEDDSSYVPMEGGGVINEDTVKTAREVVSHSTGTPEWTNPRGFEKDVFTFARIVFKSDPYAGGRPPLSGWGRGPRLGWWVDFPDADLNFSYRLQQLTSTKVDPDGRVLKLSDPTLPDYPMIYMEHAGYIRLRDDELSALQNYLRNGGVLLVNDFWSQREWHGFEAEMKRILPDTPWTELTTDHPIFHCIFDLKRPMQELQVPTLQFWNRNHDPRDPNSRLQRVDRGEGSETMHVRAWLDNKQRIMVLAIHNSDIPDGWEREGENDAYFRTFSEKVSYPLGINLIFYLMTH
ncbi:MAG: DUF4159 domain-containing protein [Opitutus sp.]|nr:DUF4159 domain-containing protein [Opitutus sp.]